jgi:glycosyltransferase involved in cell wall biosynthesis
MRSFPHRVSHARRPRVLLTPMFPPCQDRGVASHESPRPQAGSATRAIIVMPAYNAAKTLQMTHRQIPNDLVQEIILVDDASSDDTSALAEALGIRVIQHPENLGYGGNQKTCYTEALARGAEVVIMVHPDNQYDPTFIPDLMRPILSGEADIVFGSRMILPGGARRGGMPLWKMVANRVLTTIENLVLGTHLTDAHTGYRAYSARLLRTIPFLRNANDFVFDTQVIVQARAFGFSMADVPVTTNYFAEASSVTFGVATIYGFKTLWVLALYSLHRMGIATARFLRHDAADEAGKSPA